MAEVGLAQKIEVVAHVRIDEIMRQHGVVERPSNLHIVFVQHPDIILQILTDLFNGRILKEGAEQLQPRLLQGPFLGKGHVIGCSRFPGKSNAHQFCLVFIEAVGLRIPAYGGLFHHFSAQGRNLFIGAHQLIEVVVVGQGTMPIALIRFFGDRFPHSKQIALHSTTFWRLFGWSLSVLFWGDPPKQGSEFQFLKELLQCCLIGF
ncbi:MAG: Uncharacterised protein [Flavobacteriia bacterium]|nr:MAG: Uncharacterised protein [Flavobacteriia bacterium]